MQLIAQVPAYANPAMRGCFYRFKILEEHIDKYRESLAAGGQSGPGVAGDKALLAGVKTTMEEQSAGVDCSVGVAADAKIGRKSAPEFVAYLQKGFYSFADEVPLKLRRLGSPDYSHEVATWWFDRSPWRVEEVRQTAFFKHWKKFYCPSARDGAVAPSGEQEEEEALHCRNPSEQRHDTTPPQRSCYSEEDAAQDVSEVFEQVRLYVKGHTPDWKWPPGHEERRGVPSAVSQLLHAQIRLVKTSKWAPPY